LRPRRTLPPGQGSPGAGSSPAAGKTPGAREVADGGTGGGRTPVRPAGIARRLSRSGHRRHAAGQQCRGLESRVRAPAARRMARLHRHGPDLPLLPVHHGRLDGAQLREAARLRRQRITADRPRPAPLRPPGPARAGPERSGISGVPLRVSALPRRAPAHRSLLPSGVPRVPVPGHA
jgi:hypothetical protein